MQAAGGWLHSIAIMAKSKASAPRISNRKAGFHYEILEKFEAGIELVGSEVKSLRAGHASLDEAWAQIRNQEVYLRDFTIQGYSDAGVWQHKTNRDRRLLLHRREIVKLLAKVTQRGLTLVPLALYFTERGWVKVQIALVRGKKTHDKRESIKKRDFERDLKRNLRRR